MFSIDDRNRVRDHVLERARADVRVVAGAVIGSLAYSEGDRWSDLDLTFGVSDTVAGTSTSFADAAAAGIIPMHGGGIVGQGTMAPRNVSVASLMRPITRAHEGADLSEDEALIIAQRGERILNRQETAAYNRRDGGSIFQHTANTTINQYGRGGKEDYNRARRTAVQINGDLMANAAGARARR